MVKRMNRKALALIVAALIIVGGVGTIAYITMPISHEEKKEIWLPRQYQIVNRPNSSYIAISEYRNDEAVEISFESMQKQYETRFSNKTFEIIAQQNGTIHYVWTFEGIIFTAKQHNNLWYPGHYGSIVDVSSDGKITILYQAEIWSPLLMSICLVAIGIIVGYMTWPKKD